jgi:hypothetical protein
MIVASEPSRSGIEFFSGKASQARSSAQLRWRQVVQTGLKTGRSLPGPSSIFRPSSAFLPLIVPSTDVGDFQPKPVQERDLVLV